MKTISETITKRPFKKLLQETLRDNPNLFEDLKFVIEMMNKRFRSLTSEMNARFDAMYKRFKDLRAIMLCLLILRLLHFLQ